MDRFKVGDQVFWTSQSAGSTTTKYGTVEAVLEPGEKPQGNGFGNVRGHVSYAVRVRKAGRSKLYWPLIKNLALSKEPADGTVTLASPPPGPITLHFTGPITITHGIPPTEIVVVPTEETPLTDPAPVEAAPAGETVLPETAITPTESIDEPAKA